MAFPDDHLNEETKEDIIIRLLKEILEELRRIK